MRAVIVSVVVGAPSGLIALGIGQLWENFVTKMGWRGWHLPEMTEQERKGWGLD